MKKLLDWAPYLSLLCALGALGFVLYEKPAPAPPSSLTLAPPLDSRYDCVGFNVQAKTLDEAVAVFRRFEAERLQGLANPTSGPPDRRCKSWKAAEISIGEWSAPVYPDPRRDEREALSAALGGGAAIQERYQQLAACVGIPTPTRLPTLIVRPRKALNCGNGRIECAGVHKRDQQVVSLTYGSLDSLQHELLHNLLCHRGDCDGLHVDPAWGQCLGALHEP